MITSHFNNINHIIANEIDKATKSIFIAMYFFTNKGLFEKIFRKAENGVKVSLIIYDHYINLRKEGIQFQKLANLENADIYISSKFNPIHDKFCIIDERTLITGSYNWTKAAERYNEENILLVSKDESEGTLEDKLINDYINEFNKLVSKLEPQDKIRVYYKQEMDEVCGKEGREYLMLDLICEAADLENKEEAQELAKEAFLLSEDNIKGQLLASKFDLFPRKRIEHSIGMRTADNEFLVLIPKGSYLPIENVDETTTTSYDNQKECYCYVYYGEDAIASNNKPMKADEKRKTFEEQKINHLHTQIIGLPLRPQGEVNFRIKCIIDLNGRMTIIDKPINADYLREEKQRNIITNHSGQKKDLGIIVKKTITTVKKDLNEIDGMISEV